MNTSLKMHTLCLAITLLSLSANCCSASPVILFPGGADDMGGGPTVETDLYIPGGLPDVLGLSIGQPNTLTRNDRVLIRFDISHLALESDVARRLQKAELQFTIDASYFRGIPTRVEVCRLSHDTSSGFSGTDMVRDSVVVVGEIMITVAHPGKFSLDVTNVVRSDLAKGRKFSSYRWRNITAEAKGNTFVSPWFVRVVADPPLNLPSLTLTFKEEGKAK